MPTHAKPNKPKIPPEETASPALIAIAVITTIMVMGGFMLFGIVWYRNQQPIPLESLQMPTLASLPTLTATPSLTPTIMPYPTLMRASTITPSPTATETPAPTRTETIVPSSATASFTPDPYLITPIASTIWYTAAQANIRACPQLNCETMTRLNVGMPVMIDGFAQGEAFRNSTLWYRTIYAGATAYVHSSLIVSSAPAMVAPTLAISLPPTPLPNLANPMAISPPMPPSGGTYSCDCSRSCSQITTCEEAYYQLNTCGCRARDNDGDGIPCESLCSP